MPPSIRQVMVSGSDPTVEGFVDCVRLAWAVHLILVLDGEDGNGIGASTLSEDMKNILSCLEVIFTNNVFQFWLDKILRTAAYQVGVGICHISPVRWYWYCFGLLVKCGLIADVYSLCDPFSRWSEYKTCLACIIYKRLLVFVTVDKKFLIWYIACAWFYFHPSHRSCKLVITVVLLCRTMTRTWSTCIMHICTSKWLAFFLIHLPETRWVQLSFCYSSCKFHIEKRNRDSLPNIH